MWGVRSNLRTIRRAIAQPPRICPAVTGLLYTEVQSAHREAPELVVSLAFTRRPRREFMQAGLGVAREPLPVRSFYEANTPLLVCDGNEADVEVIIWPHGNGIPGFGRRRFVHGARTPLQILT